MRNIQVRASEDVHRAARQRMIDEWGDANFQKLINDFLTNYAAGIVGATTVSPAENLVKYVKEKQIIEQALDLYPEYAFAQIKSIEQLLKASPKVNTRHAQNATFAKEGDRPSVRTKTGTQGNNSRKP